MGAGDFRRDLTFLIKRDTMVVSEEGVRIPFEDVIIIAIGIAGSLKTGSSKVEICLLCQEL